MPRWNIDPAGVQRVVASTVGVANGFETHGTSYAAGMRSAAGHSGSHLVGQALVDFATSKQPTLQGVVNRTSRVLTGAVTATKAYLSGDLEMAAHAQHDAGYGPTLPRDAE